MKKILVLLLLILPNTVSAGSCTDIGVNLSLGSKNQNVNILQTYLYENGQLSVEPTGYFGRMTLAAVKDFQSKNSIINTGYVGPITRAKIKDLSCGNTINVCSTIAKLCPDGVTTMPKDTSCNFLPDKCPTSSSQSSSINIPNYSSFSTSWLSNIGPSNMSVLTALKTAFSLAGISINDFATTTMSEAQILDMTHKFEQDYIFGNK